MKRSVLALQFLFWLLVAGAQRDTADYPCLRLVNGKVPFFETTTIDGKKIDSSYFSGKITILAFFGFGCGPCYSELRLLDEISKTKPRDQY